MDLAPVAAVRVAGFNEVKIRDPILDEPWNCASENQYDMVLGWVVSTEARNSSG
jgi:hypothetical protein